MPNPLHHFCRFSGSERQYESHSTRPSRLKLHLGAGCISYLHPRCECCHLYIDWSSPTLDLWIHKRGIVLQAPRFHNSIWRLYVVCITHTYVTACNTWYCLGSARPFFFLSKTYECSNFFHFREYSNAAQWPNSTASATPYIFDVLILIILRRLYSTEALRILKRKCPMNQEQFTLD